MKHFINCCICIFFFLSSISSIAQITFQRTFGIGTYNEGRCVKQTFDGGYIIAGTESDAGNGATDFYLLKIDSVGNFKWHKTYGGTGIDRGYAVEQLADSGYAVAGYSNSNGAGGYDAFLVRVDKNGDTLWTKYYGTTDWDFVYTMTTTNDNGFILAGNSYGFGSANTATYFLKIDSSGTEQWSKSFSLLSESYINSIASSPDGFAASGYAVSSSGNEDMLVLKLNFSGDTLWKRITGAGSANEHGNGVDIGPDSSIIVGGFVVDTGNSDDYLVKLDRDGNILFEHSFPQPGQEGINDIHFQNDSFYVAAFTSSFGFGGKDSHYYLTDTFGFYTIGSTQGGIDNEVAYHIERTSDSGYILCGSSTSYTPGLQSVYVVKIDGQFQTSPPVIGVEEIPEEQQVYFHPNPFSLMTHAYLNEKFLNEPIAFSVYNMFGKCVFSSGINGININFQKGTLPAGIYLYNISTEKKLIGKGKLVIE